VPSQWKGKSSADGKPLSGSSLFSKRPNQALRPRAVAQRVRVAERTEGCVAPAPAPTPRTTSGPVSTYCSLGSLNGSGLLACFSLALVSNIHRALAPGFSHRAFQINPTHNQKKACTHVMYPMHGPSPRSPARRTSSPPPTPSRLHPAALLLLPPYIIFFFGPVVVRGECVAEWSQ
jgi:hypothetical protein